MRKKKKDFSRGFFGHQGNAPRARSFVFVMGIGGTGLILFPTPPLANINDPTAEYTLRTLHQSRE